MMCAWEPFLKILPQRLRPETDRLGRDTLQELRLRLGCPPEMNLGNECVYQNTLVTREDIACVINTVSRYSPWTCKSMEKGYLSVPGGHRIGLCGQAVRTPGQAVKVTEVTSLCIRVARDIPGLAEGYASVRGSILIIGAPGWGKTTLLRDLLRQISRDQETVVIDERGELYPEGIPRGKRMDVLSFCPKKQGIDMALRTMGPESIGLDEITEEADCDSLRQAAHCGVRLCATAHAGSLEELYQRPVYRPLLADRIFDSVLVLRRDKSSYLERVKA